jgi:ABC-type multidrug transport system ATPase subunit
MAPAGFDVPLVVRATRVGKRFGRTVALDGLDVTMDGPTVFGIVGPDGAGKTTLLRILVGLLQCDRGSVSVLGFDPGRHATALRRRVGYVPQAFSMYPTLTVAENLRFVGRCHGMSRAELAERRDVLLTLAELKLFADARAETLSGGMKQKLALCAALLARPPLLVLDEPTSGVDLVARADLWATIREEARAALVIVSTNYLDEAERCDRILYMAGGRAVALGSPQALREAATINVFALTLREQWIGLASALRRRGIERVEPTALGLRLETRRAHADVAALLTGLGIPRDGCELAPVDVDLETALLALAPSGAGSQPEAIGPQAHPIGPQAHSIRPPAHSIAP